MILEALPKVEDITKKDLITQSRELYEGSKIIQQKITDLKINLKTRKYDNWQRNVLTKELDNLIICATNIKNRLTD